MDGIIARLSEEFVGSNVVAARLGGLLGLGAVGKIVAVSVPSIDREDGL